MPCRDSDWTERPAPWVWFGLTLILLSVIGSCVWGGSK